jgi:hypothetical protein
MLLWQVPKTAGKAALAMEAFARWVCIYGYIDIWIYGYVCMCMCMYALDVCFTIGIYYIYVHTIHTHVCAYAHHCMHACMAYMYIYVQGVAAAACYHRRQRRPGCIRPSHQTARRAQRRWASRHIIQAYIHMPIYIYIHMHIYICIYTCAYIYVHIYMCIYTCLYTCAYIHVPIYNPYVE